MKPGSDYKVSRRIRGHQTHTQVAVRQIGADAKLGGEPRYEVTTIVKVKLWADVMRNHTDGIDEIGALHSIYEAQQPVRVDADALARIRRRRHDTCASRRLREWRRREVGKECDVV